MEKTPPRKLSEEFALILREFEVETVTLREVLGELPLATQTTDGQFTSGLRELAKTFAECKPLFFALERLQRVDDTLIHRALTRPDSAVAHAALRVLVAPRRSSSTTRSASRST